MKAKEFIKKFGLDYAKERLDYCKNARLVGMEIDLKRYVDAYKLVQKHGGIHMAKADSSDLDEFEKTSPYWMEVKQAITIIEEVENYNEN